MIISSNKLISHYINHPYEEVGRLEQNRSKVKGNQFNSIFSDSATFSSQSQQTESVSKFTTSVSGNFEIILSRRKKKIKNFISFMEIFLFIYYNLLFMIAIALKRFLIH